MHDFTYIVVPDNHLSRQIMNFVVISQDYLFYFLIDLRKIILKIFISMFITTFCFICLSIKQNLNHTYTYEYVETLNSFIIYTIKILYTESAQKKVIHFYMDSYHIRLFCTFSCNKQIFSPSCLEPFLSNFSWSAFLGSSRRKSRDECNEHALGHSVTRSTYGCVR